MAAERADIVIIGGGIMGASLALALTRLGVRDVLVLERRTVASGASGKTGALLRQHYTNVPEATLAQRSLQLFANWDDAVGGDCGFAQTGLIATVATSGADAPNIERMRRVVAMQNALGIRSRGHHGRRAVRTATLRQRRRHRRGGLRAGVGLRGRHRRHARHGGSGAARRRAGGRGRRRDRHPRGGRRVTGVETTAGPIDADVVVCAAGAWSVPLLASRRRGRAGRGATGAGGGAEPPVRDAGSGHDGLRRHGRQLLLPQLGTESHDGGIGGGEFHDIVRSRPLRRAQPTRPSADRDRQSRRRMPSMAARQPLYGHAGLYDMTPDAHPIIGRAPDWTASTSARLQRRGLQERPRRRRGVGRLDRARPGARSGSDALPLGTLLRRQLARAVEP